jgi:hypothetical protein
MYNIVSECDNWRFVVVLYFTGTSMILAAYLSCTNLKLKEYFVFKIKYMWCNSFLTDILSVSWDYTTVVRARRINICIYSTNNYTVDISSHPSSHVSESYGFESLLVIYRTSKMKVSLCPIYNNGVYLRYVSTRIIAPCIYFFAFKIIFTFQDLKLLFRHDFLLLYSRATSGLLLYHSVSSQIDQQVSLFVYPPPRVVFIFGECCSWMNCVYYKYKHFWKMSASAAVRKSQEIFLHPAEEIFSSHTLESI